MANQYDYSEFSPQNNNQQSSQYDYSEFSPSSSIQQQGPLSNYETLNNLASFGTGALQGIGEISYGLNSLFAKALKAAGGPTINAENLLDISNYDSPLAKKLAQNQKTHDTAGNIGNFVGNTIGLAPLSELNLFGKGAQGLRKALQFTGNMGAQGAAATGILNPNATSEDYAQGAAIAPALGAAGQIIPKAIGRAYKTTNASVSELKDTASKLYKDVYQTADNIGYRTIPLNYAMYAQNTLDELDSGSDLGGELTEKSNKILTTALKDAYKVAYGKQSRNAFTLKDTHNQIKVLNGELSKMYKSGDNYNASIISGLKESLVSDMEPSINSSNNLDLISKFRQAQNFYKNNLIPAKDFPTSKNGITADLLMAHTLAGLPEPLSVAAGAALGESGLLRNNAVFNAGRRFASPMFGGPSTISSNLYSPITQSLASSLSANSTLGGNQ